MIKRFNQTPLIIFIKKVAAQLIIN